MSEERYRNIFDAASKKLGKKSTGPKKTSPNPEPTPNVSQAPNVISSTNKLVKLTKLPINPNTQDPEIKHMLQRMKEMSQEVEQRVENLLSKGKLTREKLLSYLKNPSNFGPEQWKRIQQASEFLQIQSPATTSTPPTDNPPAAKNTPAKPTDRKSKTLGNRKKWIPMR